jgi:hypothetical protein
MLLTKVHAPLVELLFAVVFCLELKRGRVPAPSARAWATAGLLFLLCVAAYLGGNLWRYDRLALSTSYGLGWEVSGAASYPWNVAGLIVSPGKSLFIFSPPLVLAALLSARFIQRNSWYGALLAVFVIPQILFHAYFRTWADETWGPRRLMNLVPVLVLPLCIAVGSEQRWTRWGLILFAALGLWICGCRSLPSP